MILWLSRPDSTRPHLYNVFDIFNSDARHMVEDKPSVSSYIHLANQYVPGSVNCVLLSVNLITQYNLNYTDVASTHFKRVKRTSLPLNSQKPPYETLICVWFIIAQSRRQPEHQLPLWPRFEIRNNELTVRLKQEYYLFLPNDAIFAEHIVSL